VEGVRTCIPLDYELVEDRVYTLPELKPVEVFGDYGYVKLKALGPGRGTTLEINGVHMHRVEGVDPITDAELKVSTARVRRGHLVLDVCTGLGYTAIASLRRGARVVTIELSEHVLWAAERNPFSWNLASRDAVIILGDAVDVVTKLRDNMFDRIVHDPPRYSLAGELYSQDFYAELYRVLKPGGILYHYTGEPGRHTNVRIVKGVLNRLRNVGFVGVRFVEEVQGVIALKPRW
jgi:predicted methyltransferase